MCGSRSSCECASAASCAASCRGAAMCHRILCALSPSQSHFRFPFTGAACKLWWWLCGMLGLQCCRTLYGIVCFSYSGRWVIRVGWRYFVSFGGAVCVSRLGCVEVSLSADCPLLFSLFALSLGLLLQWVSRSARRVECLRCLCLNLSFRNFLLVEKLTDMM